MKSKLPEGWQEVKLGKIIELTMGQSPKSEYYNDVGEGVPFMQGNTTFGRKYPKVERYTTKVTRTANKGDVLMSVRAPVGALNISNIDELCIGRGLCSIRMKNDMQEFIYFAMQYNMEVLKSRESGTVFSSINKGDLESLPMKLPPLNEQKAIADTLSALDDKIEKNNKINENLEQQAQEIFKHWFVDFEFPDKNGIPYKSNGGEMIESEIGLIPEEWEVNKIGEMVDNIKESVKPGEHLSNREYLPINNLSMKSVTVQDSESYKEAKSSLVLFEKFDILIGAMRVYFHRVNLSPFKGVTRTTTFVIRSKKADELSYNLFLLNLDETISYANKTSKGTTMPYAVWENGLAEMLVANPPLNIKRAFNEIILPSLELMLNNAQENKKLSELRDTLLPKLMSGELRIPLDE